MQMLHIIFSTVCTVESIAERRRVEKSNRTKLFWMSSPLHLATSNVESTQSIWKWCHCDFYFGRVFGYGIATGNNIVVVALLGSQHLSVFESTQFEMTNIVVSGVTSILDKTE